MSQLGVTRATSCTQKRTLGCGTGLPGFWGGAHEGCQPTMKLKHCPSSQYYSIVLARLVRGDGAIALGA